jgi:hypothetical protein
MPDFRAAILHDIKEARMTNIHAFHDLLYAHFQQAAGSQRRPQARSEFDLDTATG